MQAPPEPGSAKIMVLPAMPAQARDWLPAAGHALEIALILVALFFASVWLAGATYNPFIYYRF